MTKLNVLDDAFGYYFCKCGHYAVSHCMDFPDGHMSCAACDCKNFEIKEPATDDNRRTGRKVR